MPYSPNVAGGSYSSAAEAGALTGLRPSNVGTLGSTITTEQYIGTLYDWNPFAIMREVHERHGAQISDFRFLLRAFGMSRGVDAPTTGHYERDWHDNLIKLGTTNTASSGAGTDVIISLHADSMFAGSQTASGSTVKSSDIAVYDIIEFYNGVQGWVKAKNTATDPHRLTITPLDSTEEIPSVTNGEEFFVVTRAMPEGSGLPTGRFPRLTKYTNVFQIVKTSAGATGSNLSNQLFVRFEQQTDGSIFGVLQADMVAQHERYCNGALLFGKPTDNISVFVADNEIDVDLKTTQGMLDWGTTYGHTQTYSVGSYSLDDFDAIARTMWEEKAQDGNFMTLDGYNIFQETENLLADEFTGDNSAFLTKSIATAMGTMEGVPAEDYQPFENGDFDFYIGFKGVRKSGANFLFKQLNEFSDAQGAGGSGYDYNNWRVSVPIGRRKDLKTGRYGFAWGYEYKQQGGYSRELQFSPIAGVGVGGPNGYLNIPATSGSDNLRVGMLSEIAFHGACPNQSYIQKPVAE